MSTEQQAQKRAHPEENGDDSGGAATKTAKVDNGEVRFLCLNININHRIPPTFKGGHSKRCKRERQQTERFVHLDKIH